MSKPKSKTRKQTKNIQERAENKGIQDQDQDHHHQT